MATGGDVITTSNVDSAAPSSRSWRELRTRWLRSTRAISIFAAILFLPFSTTTDAVTSFSAQAISGRIVDEVSNEPLAGVIIVATWSVDESVVGHEKALLRVLESVSDKDGNYSFPEWSAQFNFSFSLSPLAVFAKGNDPSVMFYKVGYWPEIEKNETSDPQGVATRSTALGAFRANGKTIKMRKWDGNGEADYYRKVSSLVDSLGREWKSYPRMTLAVDRMFQVLVERKKRKEIPPFFPTPHVTGFFSELLSAEDRAFLKEYEHE